MATPNAGRRAPAVLRHAVLLAFSLLWLVPLYIVLVNSVKSQADILTAPFAVPWDRLSLSYLGTALTNPDFDVLRSYLTTGLLVVLVNALSFAISGPCAYVIARGLRRRHHALYFYLIAGTFIPSQIVLIPIVYVLRGIGLMNTTAGLVIFQTVLTLPISIFLYVAYIRTIPVSLDEAARMDGAGRWRTFVSVIVPLMRPVVATTVILHSIGVWNDFVNPQIILGPANTVQPVTTGIYYAVGPYSTDYTVVFPLLVLAIVPVLTFYVVMQRNIVNGLTAGATKL